MIKTDPQAFKAYPNDNHWYDKLHLSRSLGYECGIGSILYSGVWIVRPRINLDGMGKDAKIGYFEKGTKIDPAMFYCEVFEGRHITIDYVFKRGQWHQTNTFEGFNTPDNLVQFRRWMKVNYDYPIPQFLKDVEADHINIEVKGDRVIEVHLRPNPDPIQYDDFWPIWSEDQKPPYDNYVRIPDINDTGLMGRLGFYVPKW